MASKKNSGKSAQKAAIKAIATYEKDSKRYHRYSVSSPDGDQVVGTIYLVKQNDPPESFDLKLTVTED